MAVNTKYTEAVRTGDIRGLMSPVLPTLPNTYNSVKNDYIKYPEPDYDMEAELINSLGNSVLNPMYLSNTTNTLAYNSFADVLLNKEAQRRRWDGTIFDPDTAVGTLLNPVRIVVDSLKLMKDTTLDPVIGSIQLANKNKNDDYTVWDALGSGLATAGINALVNVGDTLDIVANPFKGLLIDGPEGLVKGWIGDSQGRKRYDWINEVDSGLGAFALEVVTDPLNLISLGSASLARAGIGGLAKGAGTALVKEVTSELAEQGVKQIGKELAQEGVEKAIKATTKWALNNGDDAVAFVAKRLDVSDTVAENILKRITTDGALDSAKVSKFVDDVDAIARLGVKQYYNTPKLNDDAIKEVAESINKLGSYNFRALGIDADNGLVARHIVSKHLPQTLDTLPGSIRVLRGLKSADDVFTKGALIASGITTPVAAPVLLGVSAAKRALGNAISRRAGKATVNLVEEFLDNVEKVDFSNGEAVVKIVNAQGDVVKTLDVSVFKDTEKHLDELYDTSSRKLFAEVSKENVDFDAVMDELTKYNDSLNKIIKAKTGFDNVTDFLHAVQDTHDSSLKQFAEKLNRYIRYANTKVDDSYKHALHNALIRRAEDFDAVRKTQTENLVDLKPYQRFMELTTGVYFVNNYDFELADSVTAELMELFSVDNAGNTLTQLRRALVDAGAAQRGVNVVGDTPEYKPVYVKNANGEDELVTPKFSQHNTTGFLGDLYNNTVYQLDELVDATSSLDIDVFENIINTSTDVAKSNEAVSQAVFNLNRALRVYESFVEDLTLLSKLLDNDTVESEIRDTITTYVKTLPNFGDTSKLVPVENIREFAAQGYVEYVFMRSKAGVLDEILRSDALQKILTDYDNPNSNLYTLLHSEQFKDKAQTKALIQSLEKLKAFQLLKKDVSESLVSVLTRELGFTNGNAQLFINSVLDSIIVPLEKVGAFSEQRLPKTLDRIIESTNLNLISKVGTESNSMDYLLFKHGLLTAGAHNADVDISNWFKLANIEDTPFGESYKLKTKGKYQLIIDTETTSASKNNAEIYQIAVKLVDDSGNVVKDGFYKIHCANKTIPPKSFLDKVGLTIDEFIKIYHADPDGINLHTLDEVLADIKLNFVQKSIEVDKGLPTLCGHNIRAFDLEVLSKSKMYRDVFEDIVNSNNVFDSYADVSKSVFGLSEVEETRIKTILEQLLTDSKYKAITDNAVYDRIWSYNDNRNLANFKEMLETTPIDNIRNTPNTYTTANSSTSYLDRTQTYIKSLNDFVNTFKETHKITALDKIDFNNIPFEQRMIYVLGLLSNFKTSDDLYNAVSKLFNKMDEVDFDYHKVWGEQHPEVVAALDALFDEPKTLKTLDTFEDWESFISSNGVIKGTSIIDDSLENTSIKGSILSDYADLYNDLEDVIKDTKRIWSDFSSKTTSQTIRISAEQTSQGVSIMRLLNNNVFDTEGMFLNIRRVRDASFVDYFDIDKILSTYKKVYAKDHVPLELITKLTKRSRKIAEGRTRLTTAVADYLYEDAVAVLDYMKTQPSKYNLVQYLSDDILKDKVTTVAFVRSYLSDLTKDLVVDPTSKTLSKLDLFDATHALENKLMYDTPTAAAYADALKRLSNLDEAYTVVKEQRSLDYSSKVSKDFKLDTPDDYIDGVEKVEFTADAAGRAMRSKLEDEHLHNAYKAATAVALEPFKRLFKTVQTALKNLTPEEHIQWGRHLYNKFDNLLTESAEKTFLDPDNFVKHAPFTGGMQVFTADSAEALTTKVSKLSQDSRVVVSPLTFKKTDSGGGCWCVGVALTQEEALKQFKNVDTTIKAFYDEGARVLVDTDTPVELAEYYTTSRKMLASQIADVGYSTGDVCTEELTEQIDILFGTPSSPIVNTEFLKEQGWFNKVRANNMIIGDTTAHRAFNTFYSNNPLIRVQNVYEHSVIPQIDNQTLFINLFLTKENGIATGEFLKVLSDEQKLELLKSNKHNMVPVFIREQRGGFEVTGSGFVIEQLPIRTMKDVEIAKKVNAHLIPAEFLPTLYSAINNYELPGWAKHLQKISTGYKIGYLGSLGWPLRNLIDSYGKNFIEDTLDGAVPLGKDLSQQLNAEVILHKYCDIMNHCGTPVKNLDEYKVLYDMITNSSDEFASKYLKEVPEISKGASDALRRELKLKKAQKELAEKFLDLSNADKQVLKKNLLDPEMFELTHKFISNGPSAGLSRKVAEQLYAGAKTVDNSVKGVDKLHKFILEKTPVACVFDANQTIEQAARFNRYLAELQKGSSIDIAVRKVIETHFDYADKSLLMLYADIIFPFMSFSFKNLTYWADRLLKMPGLARVADEVLEAVMNYDSLFNPDYEVYDNYDYSYDAEEGFEPNQPWQLINAARLYHLLAGNIIWDTGKDVLHDNGYDERMSDLYKVFKLSPSILDAYTMLTRPLDAFEQRLLPPVAVLKNLVFGKNGVINNGGDLQAALGQQAFFTNLPYVGAALQRVGVSDTLSGGVGLGHNNIFQRIKDAGLPMAVASLMSAAYVPHKKYNTWYGPDFEYLTKLPQSAYSNSPYYRSSGFTPNYYATRLYIDPYLTDTPNYRINKLARNSRPKDIYSKSAQSKTRSTYSDLFRNQLTFNQLKYRTLDKYYYFN